MAQVDFFGRSITGQSPNSAETFVVISISNETSIVSNAANLQDFEHARRQIELFNLGISYTTEVQDLDNLDEIEINLDTVVGGGVTKNSFQFQVGLQYELGDNEAMSFVNIGSSRFRDGGMSVGVRQEVGLIPMDRTFEIVPATVREQSLQANVYAGLEAGFDTGFNLTVEESGIFARITDHLVRDVAEGRLSFDQYKEIESRLFEGLRYEAPNNTGGSEWYVLATLKGQVFSQPFNTLPLRLSLGIDFGLDITRISKRNQNRFAFFVKAAYMMY
jgi:hypothetical protein